MNIKMIDTQWVLTKEKKILKIKYYYPYSKLSVDIQKFIDLVKKCFVKLLNYFLLLINKYI